jgi:transcriptional regulator with XRE-family HTH domain
MTDSPGRKDLPLTRYAIEKASHRERMEYGPLLAEYIARSDLQQKQIAEAAGITARTIRNIVQGKSAPQADKIVALLIALGVDVDGGEDADVRPYTKMLAPLIRRIDPDYRAEAVSEAIGVLSDMAVAHPDPVHLARVTPIGRRHVGGQGEDLSTVALDGARVAASDDDTSIEPSRGES